MPTIQCTDTCSCGDCCKNCDPQTCRRFFNRILVVAGLIGALILILQYARLDESKKRYWQNIIRQIPDMPGRYFI
jgi:hypothetical protein